MSKLTLEELFDGIEYQRLPAGEQNEQFIKKQSEMLGAIRRRFLEQPELIKQVFDFINTPEGLAVRDMRRAKRTQKFERTLVASCLILQSVEEHGRLLQSKQLAGLILDEFNKKCAEFGHNPLTEKTATNLVREVSKQLSLRVRTQ